MNVIRTTIPEVLIFEPKVFGDERGFFFESFNYKQFLEATNSDVHFVQDIGKRTQRTQLYSRHIENRLE